MSVSFNIEDYPFLSAVTQAGVTGQQAGTVSVPSDGSATVAVTFAAKYGSAPIVVPGPNTASAASGSQLSLQFFNVSATGFSVVCYGGPTGSTITADWIAYLGN